MKYSITLYSPSYCYLHVYTGVPDFLIKHHKHTPLKRDCFTIYIYIFILCHSEAITTLGHFLLPSYLFYKIIIILNTYSLKGNMSDSIEGLHRQYHFLKKFCKQPFFFFLAEITNVGKSS